MGNNYYTPSNGTDGQIFWSMWCRNCSKEKRCPILTDKVLNGYDSKRTEWIENENKQPECTNFKKIGTPKRKINKTKGLPKLDL